MEECKASPLANFQLQGVLVFFLKDWSPIDPVCRNLEKGEINE